MHRMDRQCPSAPPVSLQQTNLSPPLLETEGTAAGPHTEPSVCSSRCHRRIRAQAPSAPVCENHPVSRTSGLSPLQAQGHRVNLSPLGREHSSFGLLPCEMSLLGHKEILCSRSIKGICVSLPTGTDPAQGEKSNSYSRGSSTGWRQGVHGQRCPLPQQGQGLSPDCSCFCPAQPKCQGGHLPKHSGRSTECHSPPISVPSALPAKQSSIP